MQVLDLDQACTLSYDADGKLVTATATATAER
jgi:hypothetical protein